MRTVVPYVAIHPLALTALERFAPDAELAYVGGSDTRYHELFASLWSEGESFIIIEQDIEIREGTIPSLEDCPEPWCLFPYPWSTPSVLVEDVLLKSSLGCTRFSSRLIAENPDLFGTPVDWMHLDGMVQTKLSGEPHVHRPFVLQHHVHAGVCACHQDHEKYPVDSEGRYLP